MKPAGGPPAPWSFGQLVLAACAAATMVVSLGYLLWQGEARQREVAALAAAQPAPVPPGAENEPYLRVHVAGAVKKPGVYAFSPNDRVIDAVQRAGGAAPGARLSDLNLAASLQDGIRLYIPGPHDGPQDEVIVVTEDIWVREPPRPQPLAPGDSEPRVTDVGALTTSEKPAKSGRKPLPAGPVNLNAASLEELETLPDIGPAMARRILAYRETHGRFQSVDELDEVRGIGPKTMEKLRGYVVVE